MTDELKPCPFCGGEAACIEETAWRIGCDNGQCAAEPFVWEPSKEMAIAAWNTRVDLANPAPAVEPTPTDCDWCIGGLQADGQTPCPCRGPATPLDDPRVKALVEAAIEVKADCIARADKNGVVPIGRGAWDQLTAALIALEENK